MIVADIIYYSNNQVPDGGWAATLNPSGIIFYDKQSK